MPKRQKREDLVAGALNSRATEGCDFLGEGDNSALLEFIGEYFTSEEEVGQELPDLTSDDSEFTDINNGK